MKRGRKKTIKPAEVGFKNEEIKAVIEITDDTCSCVSKIKEMLKNRIPGLFDQYPRGSMSDNALSELADDIGRLCEDN